MQQLLLQLAVVVQWGCSDQLAAEDGWDQLARTPPMGWNSWNTFRLEINEDRALQVSLELTCFLGNALLAQGKDAVPTLRRAHELEAVIGEHIGVSLRRMVAVLQRAVDAARLGHRLVAGIRPEDLDPDYRKMLRKKSLWVGD